MTKEEHGVALFGLRHRQPGGEPVLRQLRLATGRRMSVVRVRQPARCGLLLDLRHAGGKQRVSAAIA